MSINGVSMIYVCHNRYSKCCTMATSYKRCISRLSQQKWYWRYCYHLLKLSFNGASTIFGLACCILVGHWNDVDPWSTYLLPLWAEMLLMLSCLPCTVEFLRSVNNVCVDSVSYTGMHCTVLFLNRALRSRSHQYVLAYTFRNMHARSYMYNFFGL
jgi:hypothetical protein